MSPHRGVRALLRGGVSRSGARRGLGRPGEAAQHRGKGECRGHREMPKGFRTRRPGEQSDNEGSESRARAGGAWGHRSNKRRGTDLV